MTVSKLDNGLKPFHSSLGAAGFAERNAESRPVCVMMVLPRKVKGKLELWLQRAELTPDATPDGLDMHFALTPVTRITG
jgi:hypothetical protein